MGQAAQRTILFLIADTGAGHRSAANAISNAITMIAKQEQEAWQADLSIESSGLPPTYRIKIVDVFQEYSRFPLRETLKLYGPAIRYNPRFYGEVFRNTNRVKLFRGMRILAGPLVYQGLLRLITSMQPDVIVSIHPLLNHITVRVLRDLGLPIPFLTVVTDLVTVHHAWYAPGVDKCIVPTEQARQLSVQQGLNPDRIDVLGMPIDPKFTLPIESKEVLRSKFGLRPDLPTILLVGGGDGACGLQKAALAISRARLPVQLLVVAGRNRRLYAYLQRVSPSWHVPAKIFGFVQNMPELMHASDVIVTKAGPGTICEALACNLPVILSGYVPGQEEGNVKYVTSNGVGKSAFDPATLVDTLRHMLDFGSQDLRQQLENIQRVSRPRAAFDIANCILGYLPPRNQQSVWQSSLSQRHKQKRSVRSAIRIRPLRRLMH